MTVQEAIKYLQLALEESDSTEEDGSISELYKEMCKTAIRELEKQIPKKPIEKEFHNMPHCSCPICEGGLYYEQEYCDECGQAIEWGEEDEQG